MIALAVGIVILAVALPLGAQAGIGLSVGASPGNLPGTLELRGVSNASCPSGTTFTLGPLSVDCFQVLNLAEVGALLTSIAISIYVYWGSDRAELPGDSAVVPVTSAEQEELRAPRVP